MTRQRQGGGRSRPPGVLYTALSAVMVLIVASLAITANQAPPPAIAELSPEATQKIDQAPDSQASQLGSADGGGGGGTDGSGATTSTSSTLPGASAEPGETTATTQPFQRPRRRRCVGTPPRQTEDPQSPPCVPFWSGDNGGATYKGVTGGEIRVAVPQEDANMTAALQAYFNARYELYGRRLVLVPTAPTSDSCEALKAAAISVNSQKNFGSIGLNHNYERCYFDQLTLLKLVGVTSQPIYTENELAARSPYLWNYPMGYERILRATGRWICDRLAGGPARFAEGTDGSTPPQTMAAKTRVFGLLAQTDGGGVALDTKPLESAMAACGAGIAERYDFLADGSQTGDLGANTSAVIRLRSKGVTSVICLCVGAIVGAAATGQRWFPEWLVSTMNYNDYENFLRYFFTDEQQRANTFGITVQPRQVAYKDTPVMQALSDADGANDYTKSGDSIYMLARQRFYHQLLLFVSGIQMAGPNLTPETFRIGLQGRLFPNPEDPTRPGKVGFSAPKDHSMTEDIAEYYWSQLAQSPYGDGNVGSICYVDGGRRRTEATGFPKGDAPFFTSPCDSGG